jgi:regulator of chromosome condensation
MIPLTRCTDTQYCWYDQKTAALTSEGDVYSWGMYRDLSGPLGFTETDEFKNVPTLLQALRGKKITSLACGDNHDLALTSKGEVLQWGDVGLGLRVADRRKKEKLHPSLVTFSAQKKPKHSKPKRLTAIFAGGSGSFAVDENGLVWAWGPNNYGQCGYSMEEKGQFITVPLVVPIEGKVVRVAAATHHTLFLTDDNIVLACGRGASGRLGLGDEKDSFTPKIVPFFNSLPNGDIVVDIACGEAHSIATTRDGNLYTWGYGDLLQLGNGNEEDLSTPTLVTSQQLLAIPRTVLQARGGSQHSIALVRNKPGAAAAIAALAAAAEAKSKAAAERKGGDSDDDKDNNDEEGPARKYDSPPSSPQGVSPAAAAGSPPSISSSSNAFAPKTKGRPKALDLSSSNFGKKTVTGSSNNAKSSTEEHPSSPSSAQLRKVTNLARMSEGAALPSDDDNDDDDTPAVKEPTSAQLISARALARQSEGAALPDSP